MKTGILGAVESYSVGLKRTPMFILHNIWFVNQFQILMDQFFCLFYIKFFNLEREEARLLLLFANNTPALAWWLSLIYR